MLITTNGEEFAFDDAYNLLPEEFELLKSCQDSDIELMLDGKRIMLVYQNLKPYFIDIQKQWDYHRKHFQKASLYNDPLAKALGVKKGKQKPQVWDATAGALGDSILIRSYGCEVTSFERNPLVAALIINALKFAPSEFLEGFSFNTHSFEGTSADVLYFDPMYKEGNSKAAPKKEMAIFRDFVGVDHDAVTMAEFYLQQCQRLVIKRSIKATPLLDNPHHSITGKSTAYDVYLTR
jgi:16S rRNA (guanine1516-N2)-methyltransferase